MAFVVDWTTPYAPCRNAPLPIDGIGQFWSSVVKGVIPTHTRFVYNKQGGEGYMPIQYVDGCDPDVFYHAIRPWFNGADSGSKERPLGNPLGNLTKGSGSLSILRGDAKPTFFSSTWLQVENVY